MEEEAEEGAEVEEEALVEDTKREEEQEEERGGRRGGERRDGGSMEVEAPPTDPAWQPMLDPEVEDLKVLNDIYLRAEQMVRDYSGRDKQPFIPDGWYSAVGTVSNRADGWQTDDPRTRPTAKELIKELTETLDRLEREGDAAIQGGRAAKAQRIAMAANDGGADVGEEEFEGEEQASPFTGVFGFGFDGTLTVGHFKGQDGRDIHAASDKPSTYKDLTLREHYQNFGGTKTILWLKKLFQKILDNGLSLRIASYGDYDTIKDALGKVGLLEYFRTHELLRHKRDYEIYAQSKDPAKNAYEVDEDGTSDAKEQIVLRWMDELDLDRSEVAFIDDREDVIFGDSNFKETGKFDSGVVATVWDDDDPEQSLQNMRNIILHEGNIMDAEKQINAILDGAPDDEGEEGEEDAAPEEPESPSLVVRPNKAQRIKTSLRAKLTQIKISGSA